MGGVTGQACHGRSGTLRRPARRDGLPWVPIGRAVADGRELLAPWEDVDIAGPRTGKTTSRVIPAILAAPGAVMTNSNNAASHASRSPPSRVRNRER